MAGKRVKFSELMGFVRASLAKIPEHRRGQSGHYEIADAGQSAFPVFFMQEPSFLAYQTNMAAKQGRNNARSLFGVEEIPSDGQTRNLLDPVDPALLAPPFWATYEALAGGGQLKDYRGATPELPGDGARRTHVLCTPGDVSGGLCARPARTWSVCRRSSSPLRTPQDGAEKQDCEQQAIRRWIEQHAGHLAASSATVLTDDLHAHQPVCQLLLDHQMHFILTCKPEAHATLYEELALFERVEGAVCTRTVRQWHSGRHVVWQYRWASELPLRAGKDALKVNGCELRITSEVTGEELYYNAWATDHALSSATTDMASSSSWRCC